MAESGLCASVVESDEHGVVNRFATRKLALTFKDPAVESRWSVTDFERSIHTTRLSLAAAVTLVAVWTAVFVLTRVYSEKKDLEIKQFVLIVGSLPLLLGTIAVSRTRVAVLVGTFVLLYTYISTTGERIGHAAPILPLVAYIVCCHFVLPFSIVVATVTSAGVIIELVVFLGVCGLEGHLSSKIILVVNVVSVWLLAVYLGWHFQKQKRLFWRVEKHCSKRVNKCDATPIQSALDKIVLLRQLPCVTAFREADRLTRDAVDLLLRVPGVSVKGVKLDTLPSSASSDGALFPALQLSVGNPEVDHSQRYLCVASQGMRGSLAKESIAESDGHLEMWNMDLFAFQNEMNVLSVIARDILQSYRFCDTMCLNASALTSFLLKIDMAHKPNPFHNSVKAASTIHAVHSFLHMLPPGYFSQIEVLSVLVAAAVCRLAHQGVNNRYLVASGDDAALRFNDRAVVENNSVATALAYLSHPEFDFLARAAPAERRAFRSLLIELVLSTDPDCREEFVGRWAEKTAAGLNASSPDDRLGVLKLLLVLADVSFVCKSYSLYKTWAGRMQEEWFAQGDLEREHGMPVSSGMDRNEPVIAFAHSRMLEGLETLVSTACSFVGPRAQFLHDNFAANQSSWEMTADASQTLSSQHSGF
eukprot:m51a1_g8146 putative 3 5 -cyclic nucleotide phosphodiesterase (645) ;mRNA; f:37014-39376